MIEAQNISIFYGERKALDCANIKICDGDFVAVLGSNGTGKSTLLKALSGVLKINSGKILLGEKDISKMSARALAKRRAVLEQECSLEFDYTVYETAALGNFANSSIFSSAKDEKKLVLDALEKVGLKDFCERKYTELSGGEKRRVQLARALCQMGESKNCKGKGLFLDEPSAGLDPSHAHCAMRAAKDLCQCGAFALAVLHDPNLAFAYAGKCALLKRGKILHFGDTKEILTRENLSEIYETRCEIEHTKSGDFAIFPA